MISTRRLRKSLVWFGCFAAVAGWLASAGGQPGATGQPPTASVKAAKIEERPADRDGIRKALDGFVAAFQKGDAKAVAAHWTSTGEYLGDDGANFRGREALEKEYTSLFAKNPGSKLEIEIDSIRFPSRDTAVVEGHFKLRMAKGELVVSRCSFLYAREDGHWLIAIAREWPGDGLSLRDLEWLIGKWESKRDGVVVHTTYEWTANKSFLRCRFSVSKDGETNTGMQIIGKDPSTGALRVWTFEDSGGIGESEISRDGKKWIYTAHGVTTDGNVLTATNIMTQVDANSFLWHSVERTLDGEALPDLAPVKVVRVKGK